MKGISAFFPALNEQDHVQKLTENLLGVLSSDSNPYQVIIIDDGSTDRTGRIADELSASNNGKVGVIHNSESRGYGTALRTGFEAAYYDLIFYTDGDNQFDMDDLYRVLPLIEDADIVVGYRENRQDPKHRIWLSRCYNLMIRILFKVNLKDIDCSFKLFRREALERINIESKGYFIDTEMMVKARRQGLRIREIGVTHLPRTAGKSKVKLRHILTTLYEIFTLWNGLRHAENEMNPEEIRYENPVS